MEDIPRGRALNNYAKSIPKNAFNMSHGPAVRSSSYGPSQSVQMVLKDLDRVGKVPDNVERATLIETIKYLKGELLLRQNTSYPGNVAKKLKLPKLAHSV